MTMANEAVRSSERVVAVFRGVREVARATLMADGHVLVAAMPDQVSVWEQHGIPGPKKTVATPADGAAFLDALAFEYSKGSGYALDTAKGDTIPANPLHEAYNENQPRAAAGSSDGGQWTSGGGGGGSAQPKGGGRKGKKADDGRTAVGITTARSGSPARGVFEDMEGFAAKLKALPGVSAVHVSPAVGQTASWGSEPSWNVVYKGNGHARALVAKTAEDANQDAAFLVTGGAKGGSPVVEYNFGGPMTAARRAGVDAALGHEGFGGWTWAKSNGQAFVRAVYVKEWAGKQTPMDFVRASHQAFTRMKAEGVSVEVNRRNAHVEVLTKDTYAGAYKGKL